MRAQLCMALLCCALPGGFAAGVAEFPDSIERKVELQASEPDAVQPESLESVPSRFGDVFSRWRGGDDSLLTEVRTLAAQMCAHFERCDVPKVVEHYAALSSADRVQGLNFERQAEALRVLLDEAHSEGLENEDWVPLQEHIEREIEALYDLTRNAADRTARAQAAALRAEYHVARLEQRFSQNLDSETRGDIAERAENDAREALTDFVAFSSVRGSLNPRSTLARIEYYLGRLVSAQACYQALASDAASVKQPPLVAKAYEGMLMIARERGDESEGERCLKALASLRDSTTDWPLAHAWSMRLLHSDRPDDAIRFLKQFHAPAPEDHSPSSRAIRRHLAFTLAEAHLRDGDLSKAREQARIAATVEREGFDQSFLEARIQLSAGQPLSVISILADPAFLEGLSAREEGAARTLLGESKLSLADHTAAKLELERVLELAEQELTRSLNHPLLSEDEVRRFNLIGEWEGAGLEAVALLARTHIASEQPALAALVSEEWQSRSLRRAGSELARLQALHGKASVRQPLELQGLEAWANAYELGFVTWVFGVDSGAVVHVRGDGKDGISARGEAIGLGREALRDAARQLRDQAVAGLDTREMALEIRDVLLPARIREHIGSPRSETDRLLLLVHGPLENMPFELLGLEQQRFDDELCLIVLPGLPATEPGPRPSTQQFQDWNLLGAPVDGRDSEGPPTILLRGARAELDALEELHPDASSSSEFRRANLEHALRSGRCLHVATHLEVKPGESRSRFPAAGLRLDDGDVASARDIADLGPNLPLVVLSACETGGGRYSDGEGLFGVSRAFLEGGTRNLVVTLWPVEDKAAKEFSIAFHQALVAGAAPSQATRFARKNLLTRGRSSSDWSAFRFLGRD